jgi:light-regulated signal transduction histidine kinase (bacteriophytochrome)
MLINATRLLDARLKRLPLLANPAAAAIGQRRVSDIFSRVDFLRRVLRPVATERSVRLDLSGLSYNRPTVFDSFDTVPSVLLENAIKYSLPSGIVTIVVRDVGDAVSVSVTSSSPYIPPRERETMFQRGVRGVVAAQVAQTGSGLGLYMAYSVAEAHGFQIVHTSDDANVDVNGVRYCSNTFSFTLT